MSRAQRVVVACAAFVLWSVGPEHVAAAGGTSVDGTSADSASVAVEGTGRTAAPHAESPPSVAASEGHSPDAVDLNQASVAELTRLPGIGPSKAKAIVAYRQKRSFRRPSDIIRVPGIGRKTFRRLRPFLKVSATSLPSRGQ